jgi:hypothetical protein
MRHSIRVGRLEKFYHCNQEDDELKNLSDEELEARIEEVAGELGYVRLKNGDAPSDERGHEKRELNNYIPTDNNLARLSDDEISELVEYHLLAGGFVKKVC